MTTQTQNIQVHPPRRQDPPSPPRVQHQQTTPKVLQHQTENTQQADENVDTIIGQLLRSPTALTMLMMFMKIVFNASTSQENLLDPANVRQVQTQLLDLWGSPSLILNEPSSQMEVTEEQHTDP